MKNRRSLSLAAFFSLGIMATAFGGCEAGAPANEDEDLLDEQGYHLIAPGVWQRTLEDGSQEYQLEGREGFLWVQQQMLPRIAELEQKLATVEDSEREDLSETLAKAKESLADARMRAKALEEEPSLDPSAYNYAYAGGTCGGQWCWADVNAGSGVQYASASAYAYCPGQWVYAAVGVSSDLGSASSSSYVLDYASASVVIGCSAWSSSWAYASFGCGAAYITGSGCEQPPICTPRTNCYWNECGWADDGCGGYLYCGECGGCNGNWGGKDCYLLQ
jgi:hypothetical protein